MLSAAGGLLAGTVVGVVGLGGAVLAAALLQRIIATNGSDMSDWAGLAIGLALVVLAGGGIAILARSAATLELHMVGDGNLVVRRFPFRDRTVDVNRIRSVRVRGRMDRQGRPIAVAEIRIGRRPVQFLVDSDRDIDRLMDRIHEPVTRVASALGVSIERSGWTLDPGARPTVDAARRPTVGWD
ncbi:MAG: hypothetical protein AB8G96_11145 [Phycisphaerales bacterium]